MQQDKTALDENRAVWVAMRNTQGKFDTLFRYLTLLEGSSLIILLRRQYRLHSRRIWIWGCCGGEAFWNSVDPILLIFVTLLESRSSFNPLRFYSFSGSAFIAERKKFLFNSFTCHNFWTPAALQGRPLDVKVTWRTLIVLPIIIIISHQIVRKFI